MTESSSDKFEGLIRPDELRKITEEKEMAELRQVLEHKKKLEAEQKDVYQAFLNQHVHPEAKARVTLAVRRAAERGEKELQVLKFSSEFCTDKGRAINNFEADWPETLTGFAKEAYEAWDEHLRPLGYKLRAQILDYPNGMPGDVGLILYW
jgi:cyclopropane fatty-acyl-phospholipid synthase-like methyltransferase